MTPEQAKALREPFTPDVIGKLPRVYCGECRNARFKVCEKHTRVKCRDCGGNLTNAHLHLDYVGHAEITDRLLAVDALWTWEPVAFDSDGLPAVDRAGGLWIRLTVAGVTRLGYGHADGKTGPDAVKESIGDALRNAAMRFGVALDLWGAKFKEQDDESETAPEQPPQKPASARPAVPPAGPETAGTGMVTQAQHKRMHVLWADLGYGGDQNRAVRLDVTSKIIGRVVESSASLTFAEANTVIEALETKKRELRARGEARATAGATA